MNCRTFILTKLSKRAESHELRRISSITARGILGQLSRVYNTSAELTLVSTRIFQFSLLTFFRGDATQQKVREQGNVELQYADISAKIELAMKSSLRV